MGPVAFKSARRKERDAPVQLLMAKHAAFAAGIDVNVFAVALWPLAHHFDVATTQELAAAAQSACDMPQ